MCKRKSRRKQEKHKDFIEKHKKLLTKNSKNIIINFVDRKVRRNFIFWVDGRVAKGGRLYALIKSKNQKLQPIQEIV